MNPEEIARFITGDPDVFMEGWEELGIADPDLEDPVEDALERADDACWAMLTDKMDRPAEEMRAIHKRIMSQLKELIDQNLIHHRDYQDIEKFVANAVEEALWR